MGVKQKPQGAWYRLGFNWQACFWYWGGLQLLSLLADTSYWASSRYIFTTVTQGSFDEGLSFIGRYYWQVEGWLRLGLLVLFGVGLLRCLGAAVRQPAALSLAALLSVSFLA